MYEREFATGIFEDGCGYGGGNGGSKSDAGMGGGRIVAASEGLEHVSRQALCGG
jgi:hypothetical protein